MLETTLPPAAESAFVPTPFQADILAALEGKGLRTDALAAKVGDRRRLFKDPGGIPELQEQGLVSHHRRVGYYRPDFPPPELSRSRTANAPKQEKGGPSTGLYATTEKFAHDSNNNSPLESAILEALTSDIAVGATAVVAPKVLARKAGYPYNSRFRTAMTALARRGLVARVPDGYRLASDAPQTGKEGGHS